MRSEVGDAVCSFRLSLIKIDICVAGMPVAQGGYVSDDVLFLRIFIYPACQVQSTRMGTWPHWVLRPLQASPGVLQGPHEIFLKASAVLFRLVPNYHRFLDALWDTSGGLKLSSRLDGSVVFTFGQASKLAPFLRPVWHLFCDPNRLLFPPNTFQVPT